MKYKDYYKTLGVTREASTDEIKKAYRKLARKFHPDVSKEARAEERFKEVGEAYEVLRDAEKRKIYDQLGTYQPGQEFRPPPDWAQQFAGGTGASGFESVDLGDLFESLFGAGGMGGMGAGARGAKAGFGGGASYRSQVEVTLEEAASGVEKVLRFPGSDARDFKVRIPKGIGEGQTLRVADKGRDGGQPGEILLTVRLRPHRRFKLDGHDLLLDLPIAPWEAALGAQVEVPTLDGRLRMTIKPGSQSGQKLRLKGKGMPRRRGGAGDLIANLKVVLPEKLNNEERELFKQLQSRSNFNPRRDL